MNLTQQQIKTLQALRAGPMDSSELQERYPTGHGANDLINMQLVTFNSGFYSLTQKGREACPTRRSAIPKLLPINLKATFMDNTDKPKSHRMLEYIAAHPNCTMANIRSALREKSLSEASIPSYIERGHVLTGRNQDDKRTYRLADGITVQGAIETRYAKPATEPLKRAVLTPQMQVPSFLNAPALEVTKPTLVDHVNQEVNQPTAINAFRVAYTNDGCLILMGLNDYGMPIELTPAQTNEVIEFISEQITPIAVAM